MDGRRRVPERNRGRARGGRWRSGRARGNLRGNRGNKMTRGRGHRWRGNFRGNRGNFRDRGNFRENRGNFRGNRGNFRRTFRGNSYRGNIRGNRGDFRGNRGNIRGNTGNFRGNFRGNVRGNFRGNRGNFRGNRGNIRGNRGNRGDFRGRGRGHIYTKSRNNEIDGNHFDCMKCKGSGQCPTCNGDGIFKQENKVCFGCKGSGQYKTTKTCYKCNGTTIFTMRGECKPCKGSGRYKTYGQCRKCSGSGKFVKSVSCKKCEGLGNITKEGQCQKCTGSGIFTQKIDCKICESSGKCVGCKGRGKINVYQKLGIRIPSIQTHRFRINKHFTGINDNKFIIFQLHEIILENQQQSLVNKVVLNPINLERFCNFLAPNSSTYYCNDIDFRKLHRLNLVPIGLFGSRIEVKSMLKQYKAISPALSTKLAWLKPGVHAMLPIKAKRRQNNTQTIYIFYWSLPKSFNILQPNYMKKDPSCLIARILHELCCTVCILISKYELNTFYKSVDAPIQKQHHLQMIYNSQPFLWSPKVSKKHVISSLNIWENNYQSLLNLVNRKCKQNPKDLDLLDQTGCGIDCGEDLMILWMYMLEQHIFTMKVVIRDYLSPIVPIIASLPSLVTGPIVASHKKKKQRKKINFVVEQHKENHIRLASTKCSRINLKLYSELYRCNAVTTCLLNGNYLNGVYQLFAPSNKRFSTNKKSYYLQFTSLHLDEIGKDIKMEYMKNMEYKVSIDDEIIFNKQTEHGVIMFIKTNDLITNVVVSRSQKLKSIHSISKQHIKLVQYNDENKLFAILLEDKLTFAIFAEKEEKILFTNKECDTTDMNIISMFMQLQQNDGDILIWLIDDENTVHLFNYTTASWDTSKQFELDQSYNHYLFSSKGSFLFAFKNNNIDFDDDSKTPSVMSDGFDDSQDEKNEKDEDEDDTNISDNISVITSISAFSNDEKQSNELELHCFALHEKIKINFDKNDYVTLPEDFALNNISLEALKIKNSTTKGISLLCAITKDSKLIYHSVEIQLSDSSLKIRNEKENKYTKPATKLSYFEYMLQKFGSRASMFHPSRYKLRFHTTFIMKHLCTNSFTLCRDIPNAICAAIYNKEKKDLTHLVWKCTVFVNKKKCSRQETIKLIRFPQITAKSFIVKCIEQIPIQIARTRQNEFVAMFNGEDDQKLYQKAISVDILKDKIRFGAYDALIKSWNGCIKVVTSMGKQSTGKSYLLNHLFGTKFDISGGRCTDGVWFTTRAIKNVLYIVCDFEGLGSFERSPVEDTYLGLFNSAISNCTLFKCDNRFDKTIDEMFYRFQSGIDILSGSVNCFAGELLLIIKDVVDTGKDAAVEEFENHIQRLALQSELIFNKDTGEKESTFFINKMYKGGLSIVPYPPLSTTAFFTNLNTDLQEAINQIKVIHYNGNSFLNHIKLIMSKLIFNDWSAIQSDVASKSKLDYIKQTVQHAIKSGTTCDSAENVDSVTFEVYDNMLLNITNNEMITVSIKECSQKIKNYKEILKDCETLNANIENILIKAINNINDSGLILGEHRSLLFLFEQFANIVERNHDNFKQFTNLFQLFLDLIYWRRYLRINNYIDVNTKTFYEINKTQIILLTQETNGELNNTIRDGMRLCRNKCDKCFFPCLLSRNHCNPDDSKEEHDCLCIGNEHYCQSTCFECIKRGDDTKCGYKCGHDKDHNCLNMHSVL